MFDADLRLEPRPRDAHKGDFGRVLLIAGSRGMGGAAVLAAAACLRSGVGLLTVATPQSVASQVAYSHPAAMVWSLPETSNGRLNWTAVQALQTRMRRFDVIALGPGLGQSLSLTALIVNLWNNARCPVVYDADALNGLASAIATGRLAATGCRGLPSAPPVIEAGCVRVLTPHLGEFRRLQAAWSAATLGPDDSSVAASTKTASAGTDELAGSDLEMQLDQASQALAAALGCWLVLKGPASRITDGHSFYRNGTGNPGMASGGSGDCLTGILAASLAGSTPPSLAVRRACYVHGLAGDLAAAALGQHAMNAADIVTTLPQAWQTLELSTRNE